MLTRPEQNRIRMTVACRDAESIPKIPQAGLVLPYRGRRCQLMHNGVRVLEHAYSGAWMTEMIRQLRGHHKPQEEKVFHEILQFIRPGSVMFELGCNWAYYSLWFHQAVPSARLVLVEPDFTALETAKRHFEFNDARGEFFQASIGEYSTGPRPFVSESNSTTRYVPRLSLDDLVDQLKIPCVELLHVDIQGDELVMLRGAVRSINTGKIRFLFLSTHHHLSAGGSSTHEECLAFVRDYGGHVIASHSVEESFSDDGLIVVSFDPNDTHIPEVTISRKLQVFGLIGSDVESDQDVQDVETAGEMVAAESNESDTRPIAKPRLFTSESNDGCEESGPTQRVALNKPAATSMVSYSMNREDALLQRVFANQSTGFYVDVGANSPHRFSNTKHFYDRGWHGINIEPSRVFDELAAHRPRDVNLRLVASDADGATVFHECSDTSLSSVRDRKLPEGFVVAAPRVIPARTLASILAEHVDGPIDFMSVDVEGHEPAVLKGNDWTRFRPRVLVVEATELLSHTAAHESWEQILLEADYLPAHFDGINRFYVRKEDSELLEHFAFPPTSLEYVAAESVELRRKLEEAECRLQRQIDETEREAARLGTVSIWFDLTTLVVYPGNNTGIPRVVNKVLEALPLLPQVRTRLCIYDYHHQRFVEVNGKPGYLGRLRVLADKSLRSVLRPVRRVCGRLRRAIGRRFPLPIRRLRSWLPTPPWLLLTLTHQLVRAIRPVAGFSQTVIRLLKDLKSGIRGPHHPTVNCRPFLFPICLFINHALTQLPAAAAIHRFLARVRMRQWFRIKFEGETWVRATTKPADLSSHDVVVQVGWHPHLQGIANAKRRLGFRYASLVHDLIPTKLPHFVARGFPREFAEVTNEQLNISDLILTNSECTLRDLLDFARAQSLRMPPAHVLRFGSEVHCLTRKSTASPVSQVAQGEPFVLFVSTIDPRKNHRTLYLVWRKLAEEFGSRVPKLLIVGHPNLHQMLHEIQFDPLVAGKVLHLYPIDDQQLDWLYQNCLFTVYPSYYEGWGLPVSESLWYGKFCIAASNSSIPEIGGDLVDYHCPYDVAECHRLVRRAAFDEDYRRIREEQIATKYRPTTWRDCAESLCRAIDRLAGMHWRQVPSSVPDHSVPATPQRKAA